MNELSCYTRILGKTKCRCTFHCHTETIFNYACHSPTWGLDHALICPEMLGKIGTEHFVNSENRHHLDGALCFLFLDNVERLFNVNRHKQLGYGRHLNLVLGI